MATTIELLDAPMSSGKTTGIIKWMNDNPDDRYIYISPLLSEVEDRIPSACPSLDFTSPSTANHRTKGDHLLDLIKKGKNISMTHKLYKEMRKVHLDVMEGKNYTLVIDEEVDFIEQYRGADYSTEDLKLLVEKGIVTIDESQFGKVVWTDDSLDYDRTLYGNIKVMADMGMLYCGKVDGSMLVLHLPLELITKAKRVIVMTYLFRGSVMDCFLRMKGLNVTPFTQVKLCKTEAQVLKEADSLINLFSTNLVDQVRKYSLSYTWYYNADSNKLKEVASAIRSACRKHGFTKDFIGYTLPKDSINPERRSKNRILVRGFTKEVCYIPSTIKATNNLSHKTVMVHAMSLHPNLSVEKYLRNYGQTINKDLYSLSALLQWIWRSRIRKGQSIELCILSDELLALFNSWLDGNIP
jgi:hypothetical protein